MYTKVYFLSRRWDPMRWTLHFARGSDHRNGYAMGSGVWTLCRCSSTSLSPGEWLGSKKRSHLPNCRGPCWQVSPSTHVVQVDQGVNLRVAAPLVGRHLPPRMNMLRFLYFSVTLGEMTPCPSRISLNFAWLELRSSYIALASAPSIWCMRRALRPLWL